MHRALGEDSRRVGKRSATATRATLRAGVLSAAAAIATVALSSAASAEQIAVNFVGGSGSTTDTVNGYTAGISSIATSDWNDITGANGSGVELSDNLGNPDVATLTYSSFAVYAVNNNGSGKFPVNSTTTTGTSPHAVYKDSNLSLLDGFLYGNATHVVATVSNLSSDYTTGGYSLYVYFEDNNDNTSTTIYATGTATITATTDNDLTGGGDSDFLQATAASKPGNYVVFSGLTTSSPVITLTAPNNGNPGISGFQIVANTPEPASIVLLGAGALGMLLRRRRRASTAPHATTACGR